MDEIRCAITFEADETRATPGRLRGMLLRYGERALDRPETFEAGALEWDPAGIVLNRGHNKLSPIMKVVPEVRNGAVIIDAPLPDTAAGRDTSVEVRTGLLRGLSVEFKAIKQRFEHGVRIIEKAVLGGVGLVDNGAYGSTVEVRGKRRRIWL